jgi:hypothetical protein
MMILVFALIESVRASWSADGQTGRPGSRVRPEQRPSIGSDEGYYEYELSGISDGTNVHCTRR